MSIGLPQLIYLIMLALGLGIAMAKHGEPRPPHDAGAALIGICIVLTLLYWGGFFS